MIDKLKLEIFEYHSFLKAFNGSTSEIKEKVEFVLNFQDKRISCGAVVSDEMEYDLLIGMNSLIDLGIIWDFKSGQCLNNRNIEIISIADVEKYFPDILKCDYSKDSLFEIDFLLETQQSIKFKPYKVSKEKYEWMQIKIAALKTQGIIEDSDSDFASPCVIVKKSNGSYRLCQDFRQINKFTNLDPFPFPNIDSIINDFGGCKYFTKIDLQDGFHQVGVTEKTRKFTAFVTPFGHFQYKRLPFGWRNSPPKFQRIMTHILEDCLRDSKIKVYIDDILIGSSTKQENSYKTAKVLSTLNQFKFVINREKCFFNVESVEFLGRIIDGTHKTTKQESIDKLKKMKKPHDLHSIRCFTGLTGHFRAFIPNYAKIVRPLDKLKQKEVPFLWTEECDKSYFSLIDFITSNPILQVPDFKLPFELNTDASNYGSGSILYQRDETLIKNKQLRVIGYQSYTFNKHEINYSTTEKEALAVVKALKYFQGLIDGKSILIHTDHQALKYIIEANEPKGRLARWQNYIQSFDITINHRRGMHLTDADAISRLCIFPEVKNTESSVNNINFFEKDKSGRYIVPKELIDKVLRNYHDDISSGGHDGFWRCYYKLKSRFTWKNMKRDIAEYIRSCDICQRNKFKFKPKFNQMSIREYSKNKFEVIHIDFAELSKRKEGNNLTKSFLVVIDEATRIVNAKSMKEDSLSVINFIKSLSFFKSIKTIVSDCGKSFTSINFKQFVVESNIIHKTSSPYHPAGNGLVERKIRDLKKFIKCYDGNNGNWKQKLESAVRHENRSYNDFLGCSPYFALQGKSERLSADILFGISESLKILEKRKSDDRQKQYRERIKHYFDKRHHKTIPKITSGSLILVRKSLETKKDVEGPFKVIKVVYDGKYPVYITYQKDERTIEVAHISNVSVYHYRCNVENKFGGVTCVTRCSSE